MLLLNKGRQKVIGQEGRIERYRRRNGGTKEQMEVDINKEGNGRRTKDKNKMRERGEKGNKKVRKEKRNEKDSKEGREPGEGGRQNEIDGGRHGKR